MTTRTSQYEVQRTPMLDALAALPADHRAALPAGVRSVSTALGWTVHIPPDDAEGAFDAVAQHIEPRDRAAVWLLLAVLGDALPTERELLASSRAGVLDGPYALIASVLRRINVGHRPVPARVAAGETLLDVNNTARTPFFTGIQRVVVECVRRWHAVDTVTPIVWADDLLSARDLDAPRLARILGRLTAESSAQFVPGTPPTATRVVPWDARYLVVELAAERPRTDRLLAMAKYTRTRVGAVGHDAIPLTTAETVVPGMPAEFLGYLAAARYYHRIVTTSGASKAEYLGWRAMLAGRGDAGPDIRTVAMAAESREPTAQDVEDARRLFAFGASPLVLVVGSHEPRKNHLAVLEAAESLWSAERRFTLAFVGGNSWNSSEFEELVRRLQARGRPVSTHSAVGDGLLQAGYRLARFTVFPSLNEGFGLPVAESLAAGTPVITSHFGAMREIAADGGCLLVDPHDARAIARAMGELLANDLAVDELRRQARDRTVRTWDAYAAELWETLVAD